MQVINDRLACGIQIICTQDDFAVNDISLITFVTIYRWSLDETKHQIGNIAINNITDLNFEVYDYYVASGVEYYYQCIPVVNGVDGIGTISAAVKCEFNDAFIGNLHEQYVCRLNAKCTRATHYNMNYVQTLYASHPHAVRNSNQKYATGTMSGIFLEFDKEACSFDFENASRYNKKLLNFLTDGAPKVIKTANGHIWQVQIDDEIKEEDIDGRGVVEIEFNWTEIAAPPEYGVVKV